SGAWVLASRRAGVAPRTREAAPTCSIRRATPSTRALWASSCLRSIRTRSDSSSSPPRVVVWSNRTGRSRSSCPAPSRTPSCAGKPRPRRSDLRGPHDVRRFGTPRQCREAPAAQERAMGGQDDTTAHPDHCRWRDGAQSLRHPATPDNGSRASAGRQPVHRLVQHGDGHGLVGSVTIKWKTSPEIASKTSVVSFPQESSVSFDAPWAGSYVNFTFGGKTAVSGSFAGANGAGGSSTMAGIYSEDAGALMDACNSAVGLKTLGIGLGAVSLQ